MSRLGSIRVPLHSSRNFYLMHQYLKLGVDKDGADIVMSDE